MKKLYLLSVMALTVLFLLAAPDSPASDVHARSTASTAQNDTLPSDPQNPMYGLNSYIPAHNADYATNLDFYGSGDVNGDGVINRKDTTMTYSTRPYYDGTYREDINMNGIAGDSGDKALLIKYLKGETGECPSLQQPPLL